MLFTFQCSSLITAEDAKKQKYRRFIQEKIDQYQRKVLEEVCDVR